MLTKINSVATFGLQCIPIDVEVDIGRGQGGHITIVGLPDMAVSEAKERVGRSLQNSGFALPTKKIVINLAPGDIRKNGVLFDLPIAVGLLTSNGVVDKENINPLSCFVGELGLDGQTRRINGILSIVSFCKEKGYQEIFLPSTNANEAAFIEGIDIYPVDNLQQLVKHLQGIDFIPLKEKSEIELKEDGFYIDMIDIKGQQQVKRSLEIAACGGHNIIMNGSPGSGKTLMAKAFAGILPKLTKKESLEVTKIYSIAGLLPRDQPLITKRPFRAVHHTASGVSIVGGGHNPRPGEISLGHKGVVFLDEIAEFDSKTLEVLRQPMEDKVITINRASGSVQFPAQFCLVAAMNPCPCGYYNVPNAKKECTCSMAQIERYQKKISGPLMDRIDIYIDVSPVSYQEIKEKNLEGNNNESSAQIRERVQKARDIQTKRFKGLGIDSNAEMGLKDIEKFCLLDEAGEKLIKNAMNNFNFSMRAYHKILKVSRSIADLEGSKNIELNHLAEALQYRKRDD